MSALLRNVSRIRCSWMHTPAAFLLVAGLVLNAIPARAVEVGQAAPSLSTLQAATPPSAGSNKSQVVYIDFWASWCGPCRESFPWMNQMQTKYGPQGLRIVAINVDQKPEDMKAFLKEFPATFEIVADPKGENPKMWGVKGMPTAFLVDDQGVVRKMHMGFKRAQADELEASIRTLLAARSGGTR